MKSCPKCNRTFPDEGQKFCTFDGGLLIAPQTFDPNATIRATSIDLNAASERPTSRDLPDPNATIIENYPATVALPRNTGPTTAPASAPTLRTCRSRRRPPPPPSPPPPARWHRPPPPPPHRCRTAIDGSDAATYSGPVTSHRCIAAPSAPLPPPGRSQKKSKMPWIIAGVLLFLLLGGGVLAGAFFFVVKPRLDEMAAIETSIGPSKTQMSARQRRQLRLKRHRHHRRPRTLFAACGHGPVCEFQRRTSMESWRNIISISLFIILSRGFVIRSRECRVRQTS